MVADRLPPTLGHLVCPVMVDREAELATPWAAVQRAAAGVGGSMLVREAADVNAALGMRVLVGQAVPGGGATDFRALAEPCSARSVAPRRRFRACARSFGRSLRLTPCAPVTTTSLRARDYHRAWLRPTPSCRQTR